jgi:hypothetical protein
MWRRFVLVVIGTGLLICYFLQAAVAQPQVQVGKTHFGFSIGPGVLTSLPTDSSSGFYSGHVSAVPGVMVGGSFFVDVGQAGPFLVSTGLVVDYIGGTSLSWRGTCGGFPCEGSGRLNELNYIGEVKFTAPFLTPGTT